MKYGIYDNKLILFNKNNEIWFFDYSFPNRISLGEIMYKDDIPNDTLSVMDNETLYYLGKQIEKSGLGKEGNMDDVVDILMSLYNLSKEKIYEYIDYNPLACTLAQDIIKSTSYIMSYKVYDACNQYLKQWNNDIERTKKWVILDCRPHLLEAMVDIFPSEEDRNRPTWPTERFLLHKFYNCWGDRLDNLIKEAVTLYPDFNDFDKAYYYIDEKLKIK